MKNPPLATYHETLSAALCAIDAHLLAREILTQCDWHGPFEFDGIPYGTSKEAHFVILSIKGKPTKKHGHVTIYRMDSGRYEVNFYIL